MIFHFIFSDFQGTIEFNNYGVLILGITLLKLGRKLLISFLCYFMLISFDVEKAA